MRHYFNDREPAVVSYKLACCSCRSNIVLTVSYYPHASRGVTACPICGSVEPTDLQIQEEYPNE